MRQVLLQHLHDAKIQDWCGKVLYSSINTLKKGPVYLLGYNPGGDPAKESMTLAEHVSQSPPDWNEYVDAEWMPRGIRCPAGQALLQRRVRWLLEQLGLQTREVCASNLIFGRSKSQADLSNEQMLADCCWPIHEWIMEQVQPRMILCIGGSKIPDYMIRKGRSRFIEECPSEHGDWMCQAIQWNEAQLISIPHLSRYSIDAHPDVVNWIRNLRDSSLVIP